MPASKYQIEMVTKLKALCVERFGHDDAWPELFDSYDANHNGSLTGAEVATLFRDAEIGNLAMSMWVDNTILQLDKDESGTISREEFEQAIRKIAPSRPPPAGPPGMSEAQARAIVLQLQAHPGSVDLSKLSPRDREIVERVERRMAYEPIPVPRTPTVPGVPAREVASKTEPKPKPTASPSFADQLGVGLIVGLVLMALQGARRGRARTR
jgi:hypothetical protein